MTDPRVTQLAKTALALSHAALALQTLAGAIATGTEANKGSTWDTRIMEVLTVASTAAVELTELIAERNEL